MPRPPPNRPAPRVPSRQSAPWRCPRLCARSTSASAAPCASRPPSSLRGSPGNAPASTSTSPPLGATASASASPTPTTFTPSPRPSDASPSTAAPSSSTSLTTTSTRPCPPAPPSQGHPVPGTLTTRAAGVSAAGPLLVHCGDIQSDQTSVSPPDPLQHRTSGSHGYQDSIGYPVAGPNSAIPPEHRTRLRKRDHASCCESTHPDPCMVLAHRKRAAPNAFRRIQTPRP